MLTITVPGVEYFDEKENVFLTRGDTVLELEHSLVSLSKWESKHEKPFLGVEKKSTEEVLDYVDSMILTEEYPKNIVTRLSQKNIDEIVEYIDRKMSATWFTELPQAPKGREVITNELIYYWMTVFNIPLPCQEWHLNRLFTFIKVANAKQQKPKKIGRNEAAAQQRALNEQRKKDLGTTG